MDGRILQKAYFKEDKLQDEISGYYQNDNVPIILVFPLG